MTEHITPEDFRRLTDLGPGYHASICERGHKTKIKSYRGCFEDGCPKLIRGKPCGAKIVFSCWRTK